MSVSGLISNSRLRRWRAFVVAGVGAAVLSLAVAGCVSAAPRARDTSVGGPAGAANVLATSEGVAWSFDNQGGSGVVLRSADGGRDWRVALPAQMPGSCCGLVASYFCVRLADGMIADTQRRLRVRHNKARAAASLAPR